MTKDLNKRILVNTHKIGMAMRGLNNISSIISIYIYSIYSDFSIKNYFYVIETMSGNISTTNVDVSKLKIPNNIQLADPTVCKSGKIEMLIGYDLFSNIVCPSNFTWSTEIGIARNKIWLGGFRTHKLPLYNNNLWFFSK